MKRFALFIGGVALAALALVPAAAADKPIRAPLPAGDFVLEDVCAFDVGVQILTNKEIGTTFSDGRSSSPGRSKCGSRNSALLRTRRWT